MKSELSTDEPKSLAKPEARAIRMAGLTNPHIAPLTNFVDALRAEMGSNYGIPYFDPFDGGTAAEVLCLLEAPGAKAVESGFISRNNPDETAKTFFRINQEALIPRQRTISWNIVPWYIGSGSRIRPATSADIEMGLLRLKEVLELLPKLRAVVLMGRKAQRASARIATLRPSLRLFMSPHPSPLFVNNSPVNREKILFVFRQLAEFLNASGGDIQIIQRPLVSG